MKKLLMFAVFVSSVGLMFLVTAKAGSQYNWGTTTGANWITPDNTNIQTGQALVITSTVNPSIGVSSTTALALAPFLLAALNQSTPTITGSIAYCSDCTQTPLVISTGTTTRGSWAGVFISTGSSPLNKPA